MIELAESAFVSSGHEKARLQLNPQTARGLGLTE
jgi:hypothetical protein